MHSGSTKVGKVSPLAEAVYVILRHQAAQAEPRISYAELAAQLRECSDDFWNITHRSQTLYKALCEIGDECRRLELPCLAALVVRADTRRPGDAYYEGTCPGTAYRGEKISAWRRELEAVKQSSYPSRSRGRNKKTAVRPARDRKIKD
jgi:hypothetical protein